LRACRVGVGVNLDLDFFRFPTYMYVLDVAALLTIVTTRCGSRKPKRRMFADIQWYIACGVQRYDQSHSRKEDNSAELPSNTRI
jgi:hypothetical protein